MEHTSNLEPTMDSMCILWVIMRKLTVLWWELNITHMVNNMLSDQYRNSHYKFIMGNLYLEMRPLYRDRPQNLMTFNPPKQSSVISSRVSTSSSLFKNFSKRCIETVHYEKHNLVLKLYSKENTILFWNCTLNKMYSCVENHNNITHYGN